MKNWITTKESSYFFALVLGGMLLISIFGAQSAQAAFNYIYFDINSDTTGNAMVQGDEFGWGSNCELGATVNWEIWYDINSNSTIDPTIDFLLSSENQTDGNLISDEVPGADGWLFNGTFFFGGVAGNYLFKVTDLDTDSSLMDIATVTAMPSPPNQFTGTITLPGVTPPNSQLADILVIAESETGDEGFYFGKTDNNGFYSMNIGAIGTGVEFFIETVNIFDFVTPDAMAVFASGVVANNDFTFGVAADSVWGFVRDENSVVLPFEVDVTADEINGSIEKDGTTLNGRYVIYFTSAENSDWWLGTDSRLSPAYLEPYDIPFSHDTLGSFQYDITVTSADTMIYAKITEAGGLPVNNYRIDANSDLLQSFAEGISGTGTDNVVAIHVSSLDMSGWFVNLVGFDDDYPIPTGMIAETNNYNNVAPGDTVLFNLIAGQLVSGTITQDPGDGPIFWDDVFINANNGGGNFDTRAGVGGAYTLTTDMGTYFMGVYADGYITDPSWKNITVNSDTTGVDFTINETHCRVSGTLTNITLPMDASFYQVTAQTGTDGTDGYFVSANVDSVTGTYEMFLPDGNWTLTSPCCLPGVSDAAPEMVTIGEAPDTVKTVDFDYLSLSTEDGNPNGLPNSFSLNQNYPNPFNPTTTIEYSLPIRSLVKVEVFNVLGQEVRTLINEVKPAGYQSVVWDGNDNSGQEVSTGIYFYRIKAEDFSETKKMVFLK